MKFNDNAVCLVTSGLMAGLGTTISIVAVPSIKATSDPLPSWKRLYKNGSKCAISMILTTTGLAIKCFLKTEDNRYLLMAGTSVIIIPYTILLMKPTNDALFAIKDNKYREDEEEETKVRKLITKWDKLQYGRTALGLLAFCINVWIVCKKCKQ
ncbi:unnamed protein product [Orchesella dallaii]|uniref:Uncharacterized protein n=1 Tax=Orchesella dallaii TaxID=48710 RepID=A0ABP1PR18_9HEXA